MPSLAEDHPRHTQSALGQFLTPVPLASFMASWFKKLPTDVRLLEPAAGTGNLCYAFVERACLGKQEVSTIEITAYEIDSDLIPALRNTMRRCRRLCNASNIKFCYRIHNSDFISSALHLISHPPRFTYNTSLLNPPYRKINSRSPERRHLRSVGIETSNLYSAFVALTQKLLETGGSMVAITPRSFCNGPYFRAFRRQLLAGSCLSRIHLFDSRKLAFQRDRVLQENIIFHSYKGLQQSQNICISFSGGNPQDPIQENTIPFSEVVHPRDSEQFIHIPSSASQMTTAFPLGRLDSSLDSLGITVSTGRVVNFRVRPLLRAAPEKGTVPLVHPCHFRGIKIEWPLLGIRKANAIVNNRESRPSLVPSGTYLLTRRFTSKEEKRRLVACLFDPSTVSADFVAFENQLNYFHAKGRGLDPALAKGLYGYLNSSIADQYFRRFSGHTQVNARDLRSLQYPNLKTLLAIGNKIHDLDTTQAELDEIVTQTIDAN